MLSSTSFIGLAVALGFACAGGLPACGGDDGEELPLRPGFRVLAKTNGPPFRAVSALGREFESVIATDVSIARGRIVVASSHGFSADFPTWHPGATPDAPLTVSSVESASASRLLHISDDGGVTWRVVTPFTEDDELGNLLVGGWMSVAEDGGRAAVMLPKLGADRVVIGALDLATGRFERAIEGGFDGQIERHGTRLSAANGYPRGFSARVFDFAAGTDRRYAADWPPLGSPTDCGTTFYHFVESYGFTGLCGRSDNSFCFMSNEVSSTETNAAGWGVVTQRLGSCFPAAALPAGLGAPTRDTASLAYDQESVRAFEEGGHVWLLRFALDADGNATPVRLDLGPGALVFAGWTGFQRRMEGFVPIRVEADDAPWSGPSRVVALPPAPPSGEGPTGRSWVDLALPTTPCRDDSACGKTGLQALRRMGDGRIFAVYTVSTEARQYLVVGTVADPFWVEPAAPDPDPDPDPEPPDTTPTDLELRCILVAGCSGHDDAAGLPLCVRRWLERSARPEPDPTLAAFLAAPLTCEGLAAVDPVGFRLGELSPTDACEGDTLLHSNGAYFDEVVDCRWLDGGSCSVQLGRAGCWGDVVCTAPTTAECDARGRAVDCSRGLVEDCAARGESCEVAMIAPAEYRALCRPEPNPCAGEEDGGHCSEDAPSEGFACVREAVAARWDCGLLEMGCALSEPMDVDNRLRSVCGPDGPRAESCSQWMTSGHAPCAGPVASFCGVADVRREVDCAALGLTCHEVGASIGAVCVPR